MFGVLIMMVAEVAVVLVRLLMLVVGSILLRMGWLLFPLTRSHLECRGDEESLLECSGRFLYFAPDFTVNVFFNHSPTRYNYNRKV